LEVQLYDDISDCTFNASHNQKSVTKFFYLCSLHEVHKIIYKAEIMLVHMSVSETTQKFLIILATDDLYQTFLNKFNFDPYYSLFI
jgi:hypothetical protein